MKKLNSITILRVVCIIGVVFLHAKMLNSYTMYDVTIHFSGSKMVFIHRVLDIGRVDTFLCPIVFLHFRIFILLRGKKGFLKVLALQTEKES